MLKVIVLRIIAIISIVIGECGLMFITFVPNALTGLLKLLGAIALMFACFLFAIYCGWKADDIEDEIDGKGENDLLPFL